MARSPKDPFESRKIPTWALVDAARSIERQSNKTQPPSKSSLLNVDGAASSLNVSEKTVRRLIKAGTLKAVRIGRLVRIKNTEIERFIVATAATGSTYQKLKEEDGDE